MSEQDYSKYKYIFDEILRITDDGFIVVNPDGIVTDINEQYCNYLGKPKSEIVGFSIKKTISNSRMVDIVKNGYCEELALHKFKEGETKSSDDNFLLVSRSCVFNEKHEAVAAVAQVKFRLQMLDSAKRLMNEYAELEFYRELYNKDAQENRTGFDHIVGSDAAFLQTRLKGLKAAKTSFPVLITGETGTGKELFARAIHSASPRVDKPMVSINCAAIPSELFESELFGYAEGAFTGAKKGGRLGKFQIADGGTLFLDEVGDMPLPMQAKILRALQEKEVEPVGGSKPIPVDVRIISATRKNLTEMIAKGEFREDLFYRLNVVNIEMTPLRKRRDDIVEIANHCLALLNKEYDRKVTFTPEVKMCLAGYSWPGNIRELDNVIKAAYATCDGLTIEMSDLAKKIASVGGEGGKSSRLVPHKRLAYMMDEYEREIILEVLNDCKGNCCLASDVLGLHRSAFYKKLNKLGLYRRGNGAYRVE
jgi:transcriptional regulator with PAS, ATPase and Fis domain